MGNSIKSFLRIAAFFSLKKKKRKRIAASLRLIAYLKRRLGLEKKRREGDREVGRIGFKSLCSLYTHVYWYNDMSIKKFP